MSGFNFGNVPEQSKPAPAAPAVEPEAVDLDSPDAFDPDSFNAVEDEESEPDIDPFSWSEPAVEELKLEAPEPVRKKAPVQSKQAKPQKAPKVEPASAEPSRLITPKRAKVELATPGHKEFSMSKESSEAWARLESEISSKAKEIAAGQYVPGLRIPISAMREKSFDPALLVDRYVWDQMIPDDSVLGLLVGYSKLGKSTLGIRLMSAIARGDKEFLGREISAKRVLYVAIEDPERYLLSMIQQATKGNEKGEIYNQPIRLNERNLYAIEEDIRGSFDTVYIATLAAGLSGVSDDENDNAKMGSVMMNMKFFARRIPSGVLVEAHTGHERKDDENPISQIRGGSAIGAAVDYALGITRTSSGLSSGRRIRAHGRMVGANAMIEYRLDHESMDLIHSEPSTEDSRDSDFSLIVMAEGGLDVIPRTEPQLARVAFGKNNSSTRKRVFKALSNRVGVSIENRDVNGAKTKFYSVAEGSDLYEEVLQMKEGGAK